MKLWSFRSGPKLPALRKGSGDEKTEDADRIEPKVEIDLSSYQPKVFH
jgi:hypothetical protein